MTRLSQRKGKTVKMDTSEFKKRVDDLWTNFLQDEIFDPTVVVEQITFLIYARLIDIKETHDENRQNQKGRLFRRRFNEDEQHLRWSRFRCLEAEKMLPVVRDQVFRHFKSPIASGPAVAEFMKDSQLVIHKPSVLTNVVDIINELPLTKGDDIRGDLYEYLLSKLTRRIGFKGQFLTPRHVISLMVHMMEPKPTDVIGDPVCGTGGFLIGVMDYLLETYASSEVAIKKTGLTNSESDTTKKIYTDDLFNEHREHIHNQMFHGFDTDATMLRIAAVNLMLHGVDDPDIHYQDTLSAGFPDRFPVQASEGFDVILANPPFDNVLHFEDIHPGLLRQAKTKDAQVLFLTLILKMLKTGGRSATVVSDRVLSAPLRTYRQLRKLLVDQNQLEGVISLNRGVFIPYSTVSTSILVFTKGGCTDNVFFYNVQADGRSLDYKREPIKENDLPDCLARWRGRDPTRDIDRTNKAFFVPVAEIIETGYDLSLGRYKEVVYEEEKYDSPQVILDRMKEMNSKIDSALVELEEMLR